MKVLSVMSIQGDPDELSARVEKTIDPVAARKAPLYGGISSTVVRTDDGIAIYNLWSDEQGRHRMADDPEIQAAVREAGLPEPHAVGYEVIRQLSAGEGGKELARRMAEQVWSQGKLEVLDDLLAQDVVAYNPVDGEIRGIDAFRELVRRYRGAFPDMTMRIEHIAAEGEWVAAHWTAIGTHTGPLMGVEPTGRQATVSGVEFDRVAGGRIVESHGLFDALGMLQQIGAIPAATDQAVQA